MYYGFKALIIENEKLRLLVLVDKGTDIVEFLYKPKDIDFMWRAPLWLNGLNRNPLTKLIEKGNFLDFYEGGWQEILPNINLPTNYKNTSLGFQGELMFLPWNYEIVYDSVYKIKIKFFVRMSRTPFFVVKYMTLRSYSSFVEFEEIIKNEGDEEFKFMWGQHPAIGKPFLDENCVIDLPKDVIGYTSDVAMSENNILPLGKEFNWPIIRDVKNSELDLSKVMSPNIKTAFCIYLQNLRSGWFGITNLKKKVGFGMRWDVEIFKNLWIWFVYRGYYGFPFFGKTYNIAIEPWSAVPGDLDEVIKLNRELSLLPQQVIKTKYFAIVYDTDRRIKGFTSDNKKIIVG